MFRRTGLLTSKVPTLVSSGSFFRPHQNPVRGVSTQAIFSAIFSKNRSPACYRAEIDRTEKAISDLEKIWSRAEKIAEDTQKELYLTRDVLNLLKTLPSEKMGYQKSSNDFKEKFLKGLTDAISERRHDFKFETNNYNDSEIVYYFKDILKKYGFDIRIRHFYHDDCNCSTTYKVTFPEGSQFPLIETSNKKQSQDQWLEDFISEVETLIKEAQDQHRRDSFSMTGC